MKHVTVKNLPTENPSKWTKRVSVSENLFIHLAPSLYEVCKHRDSFWRLAFHSYCNGEREYPERNWLRLARESESLIENLTGEFSI